MTKLEVTDAMVSAAISAHTRNEIENWNTEGWKPSDAMRAAITAAIEVGIVDGHLKFACPNCSDILTGDGR